MIPDAVIWWAGAGLLLSLGFFGASLVVLGLGALAAALALYGIRRTYNSFAIWDDVRCWRLNGEPKWVWDKEAKRYVFKPTKRVKRDPEFDNEEPRHD